MYLLGKSFAPRHGLSQLSGDIGCRGLAICTDATTRCRGQVVSQAARYSLLVLTSWSDHHVLCGHAVVVPAVRRPVEFAQTELRAVLAHGVKLRSRIRSGNKKNMGLNTDGNIR